MITIIDYGMGNLRSVQKAFQKLGYEAQITSDPEQVVNAEKVVLPGVGAFGACMENMRKIGMDEAAVEVINKGTPFLGICVGLQMLFDVGEEMGEHKGLGVLPGRVVGFQQESQAFELKVPHIGWNELRFNGSAVFKGLSNRAHVYFVHSYYPKTKEQFVAATCHYGVEFCAAVERENLWAVQFHPEKSGEAGIKILDNFASRAL